MTRARAAIAAVVVAAAMALAGAGIPHTGHTKATHPTVSDRSEVAIVCCEERSRGSLGLQAATRVSSPVAMAGRGTDQEQAGNEMSSFFI